MEKNNLFQIIELLYYLLSQKSKLTRQTYPPLTDNCHFLRPGFVIVNLLA